MTQSLAKEIKSSIPLETELASMQDSLVAVADKDAKADKTRTKALFEAIAKKDLTALKKLIAAGIRLDTQSPSGDTPLLAAARGGDCEIMKALLAITPEGRLAVEDGNIFLLFGLYVRSEEGCKIIQNALEKPFRAPRIVLSSGSKPLSELLLTAKGRGSVTQDMLLGGNFTTVSRFFASAEGRALVKKQEHGLSLLFRVVKFIVYHQQRVRRFSRSSPQASSSTDLSNGYANLAQELLQLGADMAEAMDCAADESAVNRGKIVFVLKKLVGNFVAAKGDDKSTIIDSFKFLADVPSYDRSRIFDEALTSCVTPLLASIRCDCLSAIDALLRQPEGRSMLKQRDEDGITPVVQAVEQNSLEIVRALLKLPEGCESLIRRPLPLHVAALNGHFAMVELILEKPQGRLSTLLLAKGLTPLMIAAVMGHLKVAQAILATPEGLKTLHQPDSQGTTPLLAAAYRGHIELARFLLAKSKEDRGIVRQLFSPVPHLDLVQMIIDSTDILHPKGHIDKDDDYLDEDDDLVAAGPARSLLAIAVNREKDLLVIALLKTKIGRSTIKARGHRGETPLHMAARKGYVRIVRALLEVEAGRDTINQNRYDALKWKQCRVGEYSDPDNESTNADINTDNYPLGAAINNGHLEVVKVLLEFKEGRASVKNNIPTMMGSFADMLRTTPLLARHLLNMVKTPMVAAVLARQPQIIMALLNTSEGRDTLAWGVKWTGETVLWLAVDWGNIGVVTRILDIPEGRRTIDWPVGREGFTPLFLAAFHHRIELGALLLSRGADIEIARQRAQEYILHDKTQGQEILESLTEIEKLYGYMFPVPSSYTTAAMNETQLSALAQATRCLKMELTKIYTHALAHSYDLMTDNNQIRTGKAASIVISILCSFIPVPGLGLLIEAAKHAGSVMASEGGSSVAKKVVANQDNAQQKDRIGEIEDLAQASQHMMALVDALTFRFQLIFVHVHEDSIPDFVQIIIEIMFDYGRSVIKKLKELGYGKEILGSGLIDLARPLVQLPKLPADPEQQFVNCIGNIVLGTALWESPQFDDLSGLLAERSVKLKTPQGLVNVTVRSLCQDSPVLTWEDTAGGKPSFLECVNNQCPSPPALVELLPPRILSREECKLLGYTPMTKITQPQLAITPGDLSMGRRESRQQTALAAARVRAKEDGQEIRGLQARLAAAEARIAELEQARAKVSPSEVPRHRVSSRASFFGPAVAPAAAATMGRRPLEIKPGGKETLYDLVL